MGYLGASECVSATRASLIPIRRLRKAQALLAYHHVRHGAGRGLAWAADIRLHPPRIIDTEECLQLVRAMILTSSTPPGQEASPWLVHQDMYELL
jgi:hypothetical protein